MADGAPEGSVEHHHSPGYQLVMLVLCLYAIGVLAIQTAIRLKPETQDILDLADYAVCVIFFGDFVFELYKAPRKRDYFLRWGWLDLISSVPMVHLARWARAVRVVRIVRMLRGLRAARILGVAILQRRARSAFLAVSLVALLLIVFSSIAVLTFESVPEANIKSPEDAVWWAFATITTVGYGDRYPVTPEGRFVAAVLMCCGVGLFGTFSGFLASWFLGAQNDEQARTTSESIDRLRAEVAALKDALERAGRV